MSVEKIPDLPANVSGTSIQAEQQAPGEGTRKLVGLAIRGNDPDEPELDGVVLLP